MLLGLHALGNDLEPQRLGHVDDASHDDPVPRGAGNVLRQAAVDLQIIERQGFQIGQTGIARAKIIDRDRKPFLAQRAQERGRRIDVVDQPAFGNFDGQPRPRKAAAIDRFEQVGHELRLSDIGGCDIDGQPQVGQGARPGRRLPQRLTQDMGGQRQHIIGSFGRREQYAGAQRAIMGVVPASQRLHAADDLRPYRILRLEHDADFAPIQRQAQVSFQPVGINLPTLFFRRQDANALAARLPCIGQRHTGPPQQMRRIILAARLRDTASRDQANEVIARAERSPDCTD